VSFFNRTASHVSDAGERQRRWFFYGQDTFRVAPKLTLNYGLRAGLVYVAGYGGINLQECSKYFPQLRAPYWYRRSTSITVLRMGYGRSYDLGVFGQLFGHTVTQNPPVLVFQSLNARSITTPVFNLAQGPPAVGTCSEAVTTGCFPVVPSSGQLPLPNEVVPQVITRKPRAPTVDQWNVTSSG
jgi:hypothetical protein